MYGQIINILKQNNIPTENIFYKNDVGSFILNDNESYQEYIAGMDSKTQTSYLWILQDKKERKFDIIAQLNLQGIEIYSLKENVSE